VATAAFYQAVSSQQWKIGTGMIETYPGENDLPVVRIMTEIAIEIKIISMGIILNHISQGDNDTAENKTKGGPVHNTSPVLNLK